MTGDQDQTSPLEGSIPGRPIDFGGLLSGLPIFGGGFGPLRPIGGGMRPWMPIGGSMNGGGVLPGCQQAKPPAAQILRKQRQRQASEQAKLDMLTSDTGRALRQRPTAEQPKAGSPSSAPGGAEDEPLHCIGNTCSSEMDCKMAQCNHVHTLAYNI
ncbi:uncharacterized protein LOC124562209 [Schistocerca americana]|uniref:uncharacterized protein LOC124562209 n=1 Tax=Schistocerca americana TaxID=7009 RepID=UPI001F5001E5|nr:uncharacterized protein LOC124562209 [Schistocerca americana]